MDEYLIQLATYYPDTEENNSHTVIHRAWQLKCDSWEAAQDFGDMMLAQCPSAEFATAMEVE